MTLFDYFFPSVSTRTHSLRLVSSFPLPQCMLQVMVWSSWQNWGICKEQTVLCLPGWLHLVIWDIANRTGDKRLEWCVGLCAKNMGTALLRHHTMPWSQLSTKRNVSLKILIFRTCCIGARSCPLLPRLPLEIWMRLPPNLWTLPAVISPCFSQGMTLLAEIAALCFRRPLGQLSLKSFSCPFSIPTGCKLDYCSTETFILSWGCWKSWD